jgi:hypothetical protein
MSTPETTRSEPAPQTEQLSTAALIANHGTAGHIAPPTEFAALRPYLLLRFQEQRKNHARIFC